MTKLNGVIKDFIRCIIIGSSIVVGIILIVGIISLLFSKFNIGQSLNVIRSALLIIGSLGMLLGALILLKKKDNKELLFIDQWKEKYNVFSYRVVLIVNSFIIVLYGGLLDWIIFNFKIQ